MQNFFLLFLGPQILNSAFLRCSLLPTFLQNIENLNLWVFRSQDRYFYCKANFASFLSKLLEHIGNRMQNFFLLFLGRQILNSAFLKGSFLPAFLPNIENFNLGLFVRGVLPELPKLVETYEKQQWKGPHSPKFNSPGNRVRFWPARIFNNYSKKSLSLTFLIL